jgi:hypothetical protein
VAVGTGHGHKDGAVYLFDKQGKVLWNRTIDRIVLSIAVSSNGSLVAVAGSQLNIAASFLQNGSLSLFDRSGNLLWNLTTLGFPVIGVRVSTDGSKIVAATNQKILYLNRQGTVLWSYGTPTGEVVSLDSSYDATRVVASFAYLGNRPDVYSWSFVSFDGRGTVLWNYTAADGGEADIIAMSPNSSYVMASSNARSSNGTLYRFTGQGALLWARHISPAISIEPARAGSNTLVYTSTGTLLFGRDGSQLRNFTVSPTTNYGTSCTLPAFWARDPQGKVMAFLDEEGRAISIYLPHGIAPRAFLTVDGSYAAIAVVQETGFYVVFIMVSQTAGCPNG